MLPFDHQRRRMANLAYRRPAEVAVLTALGYLRGLPLDRRMTVLRAIRQLAAEVDAAAGTLFADSDGAKATLAVPKVVPERKRLETCAFGEAHNTPLHVTRNEAAGGGEEWVLAAGDAASSWKAPCAVCLLDSGSSCVLDLVATVRAATPVVAGACTGAPCVAVVHAGIVFDIDPVPPPPTPPKAVMQQPLEWLTANVPAPSTVHSVAVHVHPAAAAARIATAYFPARGRQAALAALVCAPAACALAARASAAADALRAKCAAWKAMTNGRTAAVPELFQTATAALLRCPLRDSLAATVDKERQRQRGSGSSGGGVQCPNPDFLVLLRAHEARPGTDTPAACPDRSCAGVTAARMLRALRTACADLQAQCTAHLKSVVQALLAQASCTLAPTSPLHPAPAPALEAVVQSQHPGERAAALVAEARSRGEALRARVGPHRRAVRFDAGMSAQDAARHALDCAWRSSALCHADALEARWLPDTDAALFALTAHAAADPLLTRMVAGQVGVLDDDVVEALVHRAVELSGALHALGAEAGKASDSFFGRLSSPRTYEYESAWRLVACIEAAAAAATSVAAAATAVQRRLLTQSLAHLERVCLFASAALDAQRQGQLMTPCTMLSLVSQHMYGDSGGGSGAGGAAKRVVHACYEDCSDGGGAAPPRVICTDVQCVTRRAEAARAPVPAWLLDEAEAHRDHDAEAAAAVRARVAAYVAGTPSVLASDTTHAWMSGYTCVDCGEGPPACAAVLASPVLLKCRRCHAPILRRDEQAVVEVCGQCGTRGQIVWDTATGDVTCKGCGVVVMEGLLDDRPEMEFEGDEGDKRQVVRSGPAGDARMSSAFNMMTGLTKTAATGEGVARQRRRLAATMSEYNKWAVSHTGRSLQSATSVAARDAVMANITDFVRRVFVENWGLPAAVQDRVLDWFHEVRQRERLRGARRVLFGAMVVAFLEWHQRNVLVPTGTPCRHCGTLVKHRYLAHVLSCPARSRSAAAAAAAAAPLPPPALPPMTPILASTRQLGAVVAVPPLALGTGPAPGPAPKRRVRRADPLDFGDMAFLATIGKEPEQQQQQQAPPPQPPPLPSSHIIGVLSPSPLTFPGQNDHI